MIHAWHGTCYLCVDALERWNNKFVIFANYFKNSIRKFLSPEIAAAEIAATITKSRVAIQLWVLKIDFFHLVQPYIVLIVIFDE